MSDAHINGPVSDIKDQMEHNDPGLVFTDNPVPPPMPPLPFQSGQGFRSLESMVESVLERIRINGTGPRIRGGSIEFELPLTTPQETLPIISRIIDPPRPIAEPRTPRLDEGPVTPRLDAGPQTPRLDSNPFIPSLGEDLSFLDSMSGIPSTAASEESRILETVEKTQAGKGSNPLTPEGYAPQEIPKVAAAIANGDASFFTSAYCPVALTRADGQRKILAYLPQDTAYVVEGAEPGEKTRDLPSPDQYYEAGASENNQFQLAKGESGAKIHRGWLEWNVNRLEFERKALPSGGTSPETINSLSSQDEIDGVKVMPITPANGTVENPWIELGWYGNVYAVVELDYNSGHPTSLTIEGPTLPELNPIPTLNNELSRSGGGSPSGRYGYSVLIGVCNAEGQIDQRHVGPLQWHFAFVPETEGPPPPPEIGGTGQIDLLEAGSSTPVPLLDWENGIVKTNGTFQIVVRELMVCEDGVPVARKFLTIEAMPTPPTP